jgi:hypothetical protein
MGAKMLPELAAVDGVVYRLKFDNLSSGGNSVTIKGTDGWTYHYIHVNNDTPGTDNGQATRDQAFPSNIVVGATVTKGQVIAYLGDSGNAESTGSHLHFEIRQPAAPGAYTGTPIDPYDSLQAATRWSGTGRWDLRRSVSAGPAEDTFVYGDTPGDQPLMCDWDADGVDEPVIVRAGVWYLRTGMGSGATAYRLTFGAIGAPAACGDLDGDGRDEPVELTNGTWTIREGFEPAATATTTIVYGIAGDVPVVADWDGDGADDLGVRRGTKWYLRTTGIAGGTTRTRFDYGLVTDRPATGDWNADGVDEPAVVRNGLWYLRASSAPSAPTARRFVLGTAADLPLAGDSLSEGTTSIGIYHPRT